MKGIVVLKRLMVEWVVVKGFNEDLSTEDGKINMWGESRFKVFKKVTENANAAMLHFYSPAYPELAIRSFLVSFFKSSILFFSFFYEFLFLNSRLGSTATNLYSQVRVKNADITYTTFCLRHGETWEIWILTTKIVSLENTVNGKNNIDGKKMCQEEFFMWLRCYPFLFQIYPASL